MGVRHEAKPERQTSRNESSDYRKEDSESFGHLTSFENWVGRLWFDLPAISGFEFTTAEAAQEFTLSQEVDQGEGANYSDCPDVFRCVTCPSRSTEPPAAQQSPVWHLLVRFFPQLIVAIVSALAFVATAPGIGASVRPPPKARAGSTTTPSTGTFHSVRSSIRSFGWLVSTTPPATWAKLAVPSGLGTLSSPPGFRTVEGDPGTLSVALLNAVGTYLGYLNVTPRQGNETLQDWATFHLSHLLRDDATSVHEDGMVRSLRTANGTRSCVTDDYVTTIGHHHFREVACYVMIDSVSSVVVGATPSGDPAHVWSELETAVAAYPLA